MYTVAIFLCDQAYGGPEEGGWWYIYGEPDDGYVTHTRTFKHGSDARRYMSRLKDTIVKQLNEGRPCITSTNSIGRYSAFVQDGDKPTPFPSERPYYS